MRSGWLALAVVLTQGLFAADRRVPRYEQLSPEALGHVMRSAPVAYVPAGICEWHGEQSACGLDGLKAEALCRMAAAQLGGVCFPTLWLGPDASTPFDPEKYPRGTLTIPRDLYVKAAGELLAGIEALGFPVAVYLSGHYPGAIPEIAQPFNRPGRMKVLVISENQVVRGLPAGDHAATWETSLLMVLCPGLVDLGRLPPLPPSTRPAGEVVPEPWPFLQRNEYYGVYGSDPRVWASAYFGRCGVEAVLDGLRREVIKALGDETYGGTRGSSSWARTGPAAEEVRYERLLPCEWLTRFEKAPEVSWAVCHSREPDPPADRRAAESAAGGGMVYPAFRYAPGADGKGVAVSVETFNRIAAETVAAWVEMDFARVNVRPDAGLDAGVVAALGKLRAPDGQAEISVLAPDQPPVALSAVRGEKSCRVLAGPWRINGRHAVADLAEVVYASPAEECVFEHTFELSESEASRAAVLDLGTVRNQSEAILNDGPAMIDHWPPHRFDVTGRLMAGPNRLRIVVRRRPQPTLDPFYFRPGPPELKGPVMLRLRQGR